MRYKFRNILSTTALALILGLAMSSPASAVDTVAQPGGIVGAPVNNNVITPSDPVLPNASSQNADPLLGMANVSEGNANNDMAKAPAVAPSPLASKNQGNDVPQLSKVMANVSEGNANNDMAKAPAVAPSPLASKNQGNDVPQLSKVVDSSYNPSLDPMPDNEFGENILNKFDDNLFSKMSDIEKQSALLSLELRREKIKSEIAAIQAQRKKAEAEEIAALEERERKKREWEEAQEKIRFEREQKRKELEMKMERLRQERIVKAYKNQMLVEKQKWIENTQKVYKEIEEIEKDRAFIISDFKRKLNNLRSIAAAVVVEAGNAKKRHEKDVSTLKMQISVLKARLEAERAACKKDNPFSQLPAEKQIRLADVYAVMEIVGKGENLVAKLINKNGDYFLVKEGTVLQSGHVVDEISETYVRGDIDGVKDYLYFAAGGILQNEPETSSVLSSLSESEDSKSQSGGSKAKAKTPGGNLIQSSLPSLGNSMFVK